MAKARGRRDGGSTVLENTMNKTKNIVEAKDGKYVRGMGKASVCPPRKVKVRRTVARGFGGETTEQEARGNEQGPDVGNCLMLQVVAPMQLPVLQLGAVTLIPVVVADNYTANDYIPTYGSC